MSAPALSSATGANSALVTDRPDPKLPRVKRVEALARRAEAAALEPQPDIQLQCLAAVTAEMARELYRMAHALDGVV
jgi:hypothetical protein